MSSMVLSILLCILSSHPKLTRSQTKPTLIFSAISNLNNDGSSGKSVVGAEWLAIQEINNRTDLLPNITLKLQGYDAAETAGTALVHALSISGPTCSNDDANSTEIHFPIILGCPWSSLSSITAPALGVFEYGQISSGATSIALSNTGTYPYFYRTIPSDGLQAQGIIELCEAFDWDKIAVVYINDAYGLYLSIGIDELALKKNISATSFAFQRNEPSTLRNAAQQIKQLKIYIIVYIVHDSDVEWAFNVFKEEGIDGYPYFYVGVDAWFDTARIQKTGIENRTQGSIGTVPWQTDAMPLGQYGEDIRPVINESIEIYERLLNSWQTYWDAGYHEELRVENPASIGIYGWDSMYTLAYALQKYLNDGYNLSDIRENIQFLNKTIITNQFGDGDASDGFIGASGRVMFDENGDRAEGLYAFGNAGKDGTVSYFGYFYQIGDNLTVVLDNNSIVWPQEFTDKGIAPRSGIRTKEEIQYIDQSIHIPLWVLTPLTIILICVYAGLTWKYHDTKVMRAASWKINLIMCFGCLLGCITVFIYGIDEHWVQAGPEFTFLCNFRLWSWMITYTLIFMPLFMKTYRLSRIFNEILEKKLITDTRLLYGIGICLAVDLFLLTIYTSVVRLERLYLNGSIVEIDELRQTQNIYGSCENEEGIQYYFYGVLALWKGIETLFGIYVGLSVSRIGRKELTQFDETTQQLLSILFLIVALCIALPIGALGPTQQPTFYYGLVGFLCIPVIVVTSTLNMAPRLIALVRGTADLRYSQSQEEKLEDLIIDQLRRIGIDEQWWKKASTVDNTNEVYRANKGHKRVSNIHSMSRRESGLEPDVSAVQLAIPTATSSGLSGLTSYADADSMRSPPAGYVLDEDEDPQFDKKSSATPVNGDNDEISPMTNLNSAHSANSITTSPIAQHIENNDNNPAHDNDNDEDEEP